MCLPARECAETVGAIVGELVKLRERGAIDEIVVVDAASRDGTAGWPRDAGATVWQERELMSPHGPVLGKGDAMWRALWALDGELVCFLDADTEGFSRALRHGPDRPAGVRAGGVVREGVLPPAAAEADSPPRAVGASTICWRGPLSRCSSLSWLACASRWRARWRRGASCCEELPFVTGYGVEVAMLIDAWRAVGLDGMAQVDLEEHRNSHQPLSALTPMAETVLATIARRASEGRLADRRRAGRGAGRAPGAGGVSVA